ncbi:hypothetical protein ACQPWO_20335, partial [Escherichia coli]
DRNRSHWSTSKTPSYTKSVSWQHHLAVEPMSCPPNAFNSGLDLLLLEPGKTHRLFFNIYGQHN